MIPLRQDSSGQAQGISWLTFYQAWSQAQGYVRAVLVPRQQLIRRVRVTASALDIYEQPGGQIPARSGRSILGNYSKSRSRKVAGEKSAKDRWINLSYTADI